MGRAVKRAILAALVPLGVFAVVLGFDFVTYDDDLFVLHNAVSAWSEFSWKDRLFTPHIGYPIPLIVGIYAAIHEVFDYAPAAFHAVSVLCHAFNAALVFLVGRRLGLRDDWALAAAVIWSVHPLNAEAVAWATSLKELVCATGLLGVIWATAEALEDRRRWALVLMASLAALAAKPTGVAAGGLVIATTVLFGRRDSREMLPGCLVGALLLAVGVVWSWLTYEMHRSFGGHVEANVAELVASALYLQLQHIIVPLGLGPRYGFVKPSLVTWLVVSGTLIAAIGLAVRGIQKSNIPLVVGLAFLLGTYLPISNILPLSRFTADSYMYMPFIGMVWAIAAMGQRDLHLGSGSRRFVVLGIAVLLSVASVAQTQHWKTGIALWTRALETAPETQRPFVQMKLGQSFALYRDWPRALAAYESVDVSLYGRELPFPIRWPETHLRLGNRDRALELYRLGLELSEDPRIRSELERGLRAAESSD